VTNHTAPQLSHGCLLFSEYRSSYAGVKRPGRDVDMSPASRAEFKNEWSYTPPPPSFTAWRGTASHLPFFFLFYRR